MIKRFVLSVVLGFVLLATLSKVCHAQADLTFSGGNGTQITMSLNAPVTYVITQRNTAPSPRFIFDEVGGNIRGLFSGTCTYSINGATPQTLLYLNSHVNNHMVTPDDLVLYGGYITSFAVGDVVTLNAATITTDYAFATPTPRSGLYTTFIAQEDGVAISNILSVTVPEISTAALLGFALPMIGTMAIVRRRKN